MLAEQSEAQSSVEIVALNIIIFLAD